MRVYAACEGGGTTFVVAIAHDDPTNVVERAEFKTTTPAETIGKCCGEWPAPATATPPRRRHPATDERSQTSTRRDRCLAADPRRASSPPSAAWLATRRYDALGVATFGPVDLDPASPTYGYITTTPKPGWKHTDVLGPLRAVDPSAPILFDTDVNAPQHVSTRPCPCSGRAGQRLLEALYRLRTPPPPWLQNRATAPWSPPCSPGASPRRSHQKRG